MKFELNKIIEGLSNTTGETFYNTLALKLNECIGADYIFICKLNEQKDTAQTLTMVAKGEVRPNITYSLIGTPCANVSCDVVSCYPKNVQNEFPDDDYFKVLGIDGYLGTPLKDSNGNVFGLLIALFEREIVDAADIQALFQLFSGRVSAEIERTEAANDLQALNASLEAQVSSRTLELEEAMQSLKDTMSALTEQAKMASLGQLVAGISHEVNTPLGVAILANSVATNHAQTILEKIEAGKLSKSMLVSLSEDIVAGNESVQHNLHRAAELISSFKQVSIDKNIDHMAGVDLSFSLEALVKSLQPETEKRKISLQIDCPQTCIVRTWPSDIAQVASNIIMNSLVHGFPEGHHNGQAKITVELTQLEEVISLVIADNGIGMSEAVVKNIFDPFFTTKRGSGGTGLGLNIVYNIVKEKLEGELEVESKVGVGSQFRVKFKAEQLESVTQG